MTDLSPPWAMPERSLAPAGALPGSSFARANDAVGRKNSKLDAKPKTGPMHMRFSFPVENRQRLNPAGQSSTVSANLDDQDSLPPTNSIRNARAVDADSSLLPLKVDSDAVKEKQTAAKLAPKPKSIIVFGFPPGSVAEVLQFFSEFGEIAENAPGSAAGSLECGRNWLRITYKSPASADLALAQNGHVMPGQYVIGCVTGNSNALLEIDEDLFVPKLDTPLREERRKRAAELAKNCHESSTNALFLAEKDLSYLEGRIDAEEDKIVAEPMPATLLRDSNTKAQRPLKDLVSTEDLQRAKPEGLYEKAVAWVRGFLFNWED